MSPIQRLRFVQPQICRWKFGLTPRVSASRAQGGSCLRRQHLTTDSTTSYPRGEGIATHSGTTYHENSDLWIFFVRPKLSHPLQSTHSLDPIRESNFCTLDPLQLWSCNEKKKKNRSASLPSNLIGRKGFHSYSDESGRRNFLSFTGNDNEIIENENEFTEEKV